MNPVRRITKICFIALLGVLLAWPAAARADRLTQHWKETAKAFTENKFTVAKAIEVAEAESKGKAVSVHTVLLAQKLSIWVHCYGDGKCTVVPVDPKTGKSGTTKTGGSADLSCSTGEEAVRLMDAAKLNIAKAVETAETQSKGKVVAVKTEVKNGALNIVLVTVVGEKAQLISVDGKSGQVTGTTDVKEPAKKGD